jgi:hypothetical protein
MVSAQRTGHRDRLSAGVLQDETLHGDHAWLEMPALRVRLDATQENWKAAHLCGL